MAKDKTIHRAWSQFQVKAATVDSQGQGILEGIATTPTTDRMGDIVEPKGAVFKLPLPFLWQHDKSQPLGHVIEAKVTDAGIWIKAQIKLGILPEIDRAWTLIKEGLVQGLSIGFRALEAADIKGTWGIHFTSWDWLELSAVTIPANGDCSIEAVKAFDKQTLRAVSGEEQGERVVRIAPGVSGTTIPPKGDTKVTLKEQMAAFEAKRAANNARMDAILAESAGATFNKEQKAEYDQLDADVKEIDEHLIRLRSREKSLAENATPAAENRNDAPPANSPKSATVRNGDGRIVANSNLPKGQSFVRMAGALALAKGNVSQALEIAKRWKDSTPEVSNVLEFASKRGGTLGMAEDLMMQKTAVAAGTTTDSTWASPLVQYDNMASEFVALLRPQTILGKLQGLRRVPFNIRFPSQSAGSSMGWVGQALPKKVSKLTLGTNTLGFAKAAGIVVITKELAMFSSPSAEDLVRTDMIESMRAFLDQQFIDPGVAASANVSPASVTNGLTSQNQATGSTLATFEVDAAAAMAVLMAGEIDFTSAVWITDPYTAMKIGMLRDASGDYAFPGVSMKGGELYGVPLITSNSVPHSVSAGSILVLMAQPEIFLSDEGGMEIDASDQASIELNDAPAGGEHALTSLWQNNLIGIRLERVINWQRRRTAAVTYIDNLHL